MATLFQILLLPNFKKKFVTSLDFQVIGSSYVQAEVYTGIFLCQYVLPLLILGFFVCFLNTYSFLQYTYWLYPATPFH